LSYFAHRQTDRQTNKVWQKHYLFGGGIKLKSVLSVYFVYARTVRVDSGTFSGTSRTRVCAEKSHWIQRSCRPTGRRQYI